MRIKRTLELTGEDIAEAVAQWLSGAEHGVIKAEDVRLEIKEGCMTIGAKSCYQARIERYEEEKAKPEQPPYPFRSEVFVHRPGEWSMDAQRLSGKRYSSDGDNVLDEEGDYLCAYSHLRKDEKAPTSDAGE